MIRLWCIIPRKAFLLRRNNEKIVKFQVPVNFVNWREKTINLNRYDEVENIDIKF